MRVYVISDKVVVCAEPPAALGDGAILVASRDELLAAKLSSKRLLALWNSLPGAEQLTKIGDRSAMIDKLWAAMQALPDPSAPEPRHSKQAAVIALLRRAEGATVAEIMAATGWQPHSVRGFFAGTLKKKLGLTLASAKEEGGRVYRIVECEKAEPAHAIDAAGTAIVGPVHPAA
jgi:hypothetical protein